MSNQFVTTADGVRLFINVKGNGPNVVVVPNAITMEDDFDALLPGRTLVFYDPRNRGRSESVTDAATLSRGILNDVDDLDAVRRHVGAERIDLLGHSYFGLLVALYAMKHSDHVRRMVQIGPLQPNLTKQYPPPLSNDDDVKRAVFAELGKLQAAPPSDPIARCRQAWSILHRLYVYDARDVAKIAHWGFCEHGNERNMLAYLNQYIMPSVAALKLSEADFAKVSMPVLVVHGDKDRSAPYGGGRDWAALLPQARLLTTANAAHVPWVEAPEPTMRSLEVFLNGDWPTQAEIVS